MTKMLLEWRGRHQRLLPAAGRRQSSASQINDIRLAEQQANGLSDNELRSAAASCMAVNRRGRHNTVEFCGLVAEAVHRTHGFQMHDVQLRALAVGSSGSILEMQTGEGKTIVTGAIAAVQSLGSASVHVSTTNTYLAARDLEEMRPVFERLGLTCGLLSDGNNEAVSRRAYRQQIVYGPGYQFGFDYLRDQMHLRNARPNDLGRATASRIRGTNRESNQLQTNGFQVALVDEADGVMIDEATTPLIISLPSRDQHDPKAYVVAKSIADRFEEGTDYILAPQNGAITVSDRANQKAHDVIATNSQLHLSRPWRIYIRNALQARLTLKRNVDYVVVDGMVQIVDQYTGRIQPDRTWQDGLHQAIEANEGVEIKAGRESTAQVTRQRFLQMYSTVGGLTGTAVSARDEFQNVYGCNVVEIPTHRKCIRQSLKTRFFGTLDAKLEAIANDVKHRHSAGQPVLVGTKTIEESLQMHDALKAKGMQPVVLNGIQDQEEADIVSQAGGSGAITLATNMAGRGTDIKPDDAALEAGGLHVIGVSPNLSPRIDRQLAGRAARQGQPGSCQFFAAADDVLFMEHAPSLSRSIKRRSRRTGESASFQIDLNRLQMGLEKKRRQQREAMMLRDRWMDTVRESIEKK